MAPLINTNNNDFIVVSIQYRVSMSRMQWEMSRSNADDRRSSELLVSYPLTRCIATVP